MLNFKPVYFLVISGLDFSQNLKEIVDKDFVCLYQSHVETYMWTYVCTCPQLCFAVFTLSKVSSNPTPKHIAAIQQVY